MDNNERREKLRNFHLDVDRYGCVVPARAGSWLVCFVPRFGERWWYRWVPGVYKHCFALRYQGGQWVVFETWWTRIFVAAVTSAEATRYLLLAAKGEMVLVPEHIPGTGGQVRGWMTCAGMIAYMLGRPYWVWTPSGLCRKLKSEATAKPIDPIAILTDEGQINTRAIERFFLE